MRAAVVDRYGGPDVVRIVDVPTPAPRADEVVVHVHAAAVTSGDARIRGARFPRGFGPPARLALGLRRPRRPILGSSFAGVVEAVGSKVNDFERGEHVCGMTGTKMGTHAEYVAVPANRLARTPSTVTDDDAAGVLFGGTTALFFLRDKASVGPGTSVLVNGASGAVGTNAVQIAKHLGASVTAVTSAPNTALVTRLGADHVIDYSAASVLSIPDRFDVVLDTIGTLSATSGRRLLKADGVLVLVVASLWENIRARGGVVAGSSPERVEDFEFLLRLVAEGAITVVHDQHFDLDHIADAYRCVDSGHKVGNIIVRP